MKEGALGAGPTSDYNFVALERWFWILGWGFSMINIIASGVLFSEQIIHTQILVEVSIASNELTVITQWAEMIG